MTNYIQSFIHSIGNWKLEIGNYRQGTVLLPTILIISAVLATVGVGGLLIGVALNRSNVSIRLSQAALAGARAGIQDAYRRVIRNPSWAPACASLSAPTYTLSLGGGDISVSVCANKIGSQYVVQSMGAAKARYQRRLDAVIELDQATNQARLVSTNEVPY